MAMLFGAALLSAAGEPCYARLVAIQNYDQLFAKSDVIVIARAVGGTRDTGETTTFPDMSVQDSKGRQGPVRAIGVETRFRVLKALKGHVGPTFVLHHLREAPDDGVEINGPTLVFFGDQDGEHQDVLLFLKREADGRYAPYGGQTDPVGSRSIQALTPPD